ncbi:MAG: hypothetical protein E7607_06305 [Ruminococcaceae bacterium]|nr:hypothetical protein [Oscillospiraceae bacterium]
MIENKKYDISEELIKNILNDYSKTCGVSTFKGDIIITNEMSRIYFETRKDLTDQSNTKYNELEQLHGFIIPPKEISGTFTIVLNEDFVYESEESFWIGTLVHEAVHTNDYIDYLIKLKSNSYDELFDKDSHDCFKFWTEFHARAIGLYFQRKYLSDNINSKEYLEYIIQTEFVFRMNYMINNIRATNDSAQKNYELATFLGRLATWQYLYPHEFSGDFIRRTTSMVPWFEELFSLLTKYDSLEKIFPHFEKIQTILNTCF